MAIIKITSAKSGTGGLEKYLKQEEKTEEILMTGKDCNIKNFSKDFEIVRNINDKKEGRQHYHIVQSFNQKETTYELAHKIGVEFANFEKFKGYQVAIVTHKDKEHIHNHIIINSVNFENGKKFQQSKSDLYRMRDFSDRLCIENGLSIIEKKEMQGEVRAYKKDKYQVIKKSFENKIKSYLVDTALAVEKSLEKATSKQDFILEMSKQGYKTIWTEERKNITFENKEGKKVRLSNLEKTFNNENFRQENLMQLFFLNFERDKIEKEKRREQEIEEIRKEKTKELKQKKQEITSLYNQKSTLKTDTEDVVKYKRRIEQNYQFSQYKKNIKEDKEKLVNIYKKYISKEKLQEIKSNYILNFNNKIDEQEEIKTKFNIEKSKQISIFNFRAKKDNKENIKNYEIKLEQVREEIAEIDKNFYQLDFDKISENIEKQLNNKLQVVNEEYKKLEKELQKYEQIESVEYENMQECKLLYIYKTDDYVYLSDQKVKIIADLKIDKCNIYKNLKDAIKDLENHRYTKSQKQLEIEELGKARKKSNYLER